MAARTSGRGRELTPLDRERIRLHLALIPTYIWLVYGWKDLLLNLPLGFPGAHVHLARDFIQFYHQGLIANARDVQALYDIDRWAEMLPRIIPMPPGLRYPPVYGPQVSVLFSPLAKLPYSSALAVWILISLVVYLACGYAIWRICPRLRERVGTVAVLLLADPALHFTLSFSQASPIGLICVTAAFFALRANRRFLAGIAIGSLIYKPQLGIAAAVIFTGAREWRIVLGAIAGAALQFGVGCAFWGPSILGDYVRSLRRLAPNFSAQFEPFRFQMHSLRAFFELLGLPGNAALAAYGVASVLTLVVALRCWRARGPLALRYSALLVATILVDPHVYAYDLILLMPAFLLLWDWILGERDCRVGQVLPWLRVQAWRQRSFSPPFQWLLYVCYLSPLFVTFAILARIQVSVVASSVLGLVLWRVLHERVSIEAQCVSGKGSES